MEEKDTTYSDTEDLESESDWGFGITGGAGRDPDRSDVPRKTDKPSSGIPFSVLADAPGNIVDRARRPLTEKPTPTVVSHSTSKPEPVKVKKPKPDKTPISNPKPVHAIGDPVPASVSSFVDSLDPDPDKNPALVPAPSPVSDPGDPGIMPDGHPPTPRPPTYRYTTDATKPERHSREFFRYLSGLPPWALRRCMLYVYRLSPVITIPPGSKKAIAIIPGEDVTELTPDVILRTHGAGDYNLMFNDQTSKTNGRNTLAECKLVTERDMENHPPIIQNMAWVNWHDPANKWYVDYLVKSRIAVPDTGLPVLEAIWRNSEQNQLQSDTKEEEDDMAQAAAITEITKEILLQNRELSAQAAASNRNRADNQQQGRTSAGELTEVTNIIAGMAKQTMDVIASAREIQASTAMGGMSLKDVLELANAGKKDDNLVVAVLQDQMREMRQERAHERALELERAKAVPQTQAQAQAQSAQSPLDQLSQLAKIKESLAGLFPEASGSTGGGNVWVELLKPALPALLKVAGAVIMQMQQPQAAATPIASMPNPQQPLLPGTPQQYVTAPQAGQQGVQVTTAAPQPFSLSQGQPGPVQTDPGPIEQILEDDSVTDLRMRVAQLAPYMPTVGPWIVKAMVQGQTGHEFAQQFINIQNRHIYESLVGMGADAIHGACSQEPTTASVYMHCPDEFSLFIMEFVSGPDAATADTAEEEPEGDGENVKEGGPAKRVN